MRKEESKGEKIKKVKKEKKGRLLVQIGVLFFLLFLVVIPAFVVIQVMGNTMTYLEAKREHLTPIMKNAQVQVEKYLTNLEWYAQYWMAHPTEVVQRTEEIGANVLAISDFETEYGVSLYDITIDQLNALPEDQQLLAASYIYSSFSFYLSLSQWQLVNEQLFIIDVHKETFGILYDVASEIESEEKEKPRLGLRLWGEEDDECPMALLDYAEGKSTEIRFERVESGKFEVYYYVGFYPVVKNGEIIYVIGIMHDWSEYHSTLIRNLILLITISVGLILAAAVVLLHFVNRTALRPLKKIQYAVREYRKDKNSVNVIDKMNHITQNNELGDLAYDVSDLVEEIDRYNDENSRLVGERKRVETELSLASEIQNGVLPMDFPVEKDYRLYASMNPAKEVGGDFYDFFPVDDIHVGLVVGDVSGKGVPAALVMMITKMLIKQYALAGHSPATVLKKTNDTLCADNKTEMFVTVWFGIMDRTTGKIVASSAGHEFPILRDGTGEFRLLKDKHGFVLGGMEMSRYKEYEICLEPGGTLFIYSDGAPEATNAADELFGTDRMLEALNRDPDLQPEELCKALDEAINVFVGEAPQFDDLTMLCVRYNGWEAEADREAEQN